MMRFAILLLLLLASCADRAALTAQYQADQHYYVEQACLRQCVTRHDSCLWGPHSAGACAQHFSDCSRDCY
jgi:hypothetical protein